APDRRRHQGGARGGGGGGGVIRRPPGYSRAGRRGQRPRRAREDDMKIMIAWLAAIMALVASPVLAESGAPAGPQFEVDAFWPKPLPNKWILGQVSGIATDRYDRIWVVRRPASLTPRVRAAEQNPSEAKCCVAAPPVLVFDQSGNLLRHWGGPGEGFQWPPERAWNFHR